MKRPLLTPLFVFFAFFIFSCKNATKKADETIAGKDTTIVGKIGEIEEDNEYDGPAERYAFEFERVKDPALGYVPEERLMKAVEYTVKQKNTLRTMRTQDALSWTERGPVYDFVGASGNPRGGSGTNYTAGRTRAILIDTVNDPTGNTVFAGGADGGLWKCTNFISGGNTPNWVPIDDRLDNLAISYICQDPTTPNTMYFSTGEPYSNADAVIGLGVWKSTNSGTSWTRLNSSAGFRKMFKLVCDASGNLYLANRTTTSPASNAAGIYRSTDGGTSWQEITPTVRTSTNAICTDIEFSLNGRLHASFGYNSSSTDVNRVQHQYTDNPATVSSAAGWVPSVGIRISSATAHRLELASFKDTLYAVTTNVSNNVDSCYKSVDGGATWTKQNANAYTANLTNTQGWYDLTLAINPANTAQFMVGGLDAYKSTNSGGTITRQTFWVTSAPYVHADHHFMQWGVAGLSGRIVIGCDGGVFLSNDDGATFSDRNSNLAIKQFYSGAIHPNAGSNYMLAGAQDNGVHQLTQPGKSYSTEVTGGDGAFVHINQQNPQIQFGSYVFNQYRRSTDGGNTWTSINISTTAGRFINPWDYDDGQNALYACWSKNNILRWRNAHNSTNADSLTLSLSSTPAAFKVSPFTKDRVYIGTDSGRIVRLDNAALVTNANVGANVADISGAIPLGAYINCINTGSSDNVLVATNTRYGVQHVWYSTNGGTAWTNIDGNLPDMPVRWAVIDPQNDAKIYLATEAGVYYTDAVNGSSTSWTSDPNFPTVRTDMLQVRLSDNTMMAATHGRGVYTATIPASPEIRFNAPFATVTETTAGTIDCRGYTDYTVNVSAVAAPTGDATISYSLQAGFTAMEGIDFEYTTNGNFAAPSKQQVFADGAAETKTITIRIYDDEAIEGDETFALTFSVAGTTNAFAGTYDTYNFTIKDNDVAPAPVTAGSKTVGNGSAGTFTQPFRSEFQKARSQFIYLGTELRAAGLAPGNITAIGFNIISKTSTQPYNGLTVSLKQTSANNFPTATFESGTILYYSANYSTVSGINTFALMAPYYWDGESNVLVEVCYDNTTASGSGDAVSATATPDAKAVWNRASTGTGCSLSAVFNQSGSLFTRPDIIFTGNVGNPPALALNTSKTTTLTPNDDIPYYDNLRNIIARFGSSSDNFGCTEVKIDRDTTGGAKPFWNNNPANFVMSKTFFVTPTTNNASGQYQVTLYFTAQERARWEAITGNSWGEIKLIKTQGPISNVTPGNPNGAGTIEIVTPTFGNYGSDYTLSYTFNTGLSGFGAGSPGFTLPVTLLTFEGRLDNNTALLNWSTTSEQNAKNFEIEKSTDGTTFFTIGSVNAAGNSSMKKDYSFRDAQLTNYNYYRLRMNDRDGHNKRSNIVLINYSSTVQKVWVVNNPFKDFIDIRFARQGVGAKLQLFYANGTLLTEKQIANPSGQVNWQLPASLSAGSYVLRTVVDGQVFSFTLIKQ